MGSSERSRADIPATRTTELDAVFMKWLGRKHGAEYRAGASAVSDGTAYACPACKSLLLQQPEALNCPRCSRAYPVTEGIPDFIGEKLSQSADPLFRRMRFIDRMARIYESRLWYPIVLNIYGGFHSLSFHQLIHKVTRKVQAISGRILDVACGPGTYGRRVASASKEVFGIDISMGMLRQGADYVRHDGIPNTHFARARVESLPFGDGFFEAALCGRRSGLFANTQPTSVKSI